MTSDVNRLAQFLSSNTKPHPGNSIRYSELFTTFNRWNHEPLNRYRFSEALDALGFPRVLGKGNYTFVNNLELIVPANDHGINQHVDCFTVSIHGRKFPGRFDTLGEARLAKAIGMNAKYWN